MIVIEKISFTYILLILYFIDIINSNDRIKQNVPPQISKTGSLITQIDPLQGPLKPGQHKLHEHRPAMPFPHPLAQSLPAIRLQPLPSNQAQPPIPPQRTLPLLHPSSQANAAGAKGHRRRSWDVQAGSVQVIASVCRNWEALLCGVCGVLAGGSALGF
jgi:hypothetical protein